MERTATKHQLRTFESKPPGCIAYHRIPYAFGCQSKLRTPEQFSKLKKRKIKKQMTRDMNKDLNALDFVLFLSNGRL